MFVPRALRLKGVKETRKPKPTKPQALPSVDASSEDALVHAMQRTSTRSAATSPAPQQKHETKQAKGPRFTHAPITTEYMAQLVAGVELMFTDYAHQDLEGAKWLQDRYREVDAEEKYIHLMALLEHPNIAMLKPVATQSLLQQALQQNSSETIELSKDGFYVRRRPSTYPSSFVPSNSFQVMNDEGLGFWDQRTIYVEPHIRHLCKTPAKVAHWLKEHGQLKAKWLPIQAVHFLWNSCAFVVLSGNIMHEDQWKKWRATDRPENWKIMTKVEHTKRTAEYVALLKASRDEVNRKSSNSAVVEDSSSTVWTTSNLQTARDGQQAGQEKKRKRGQEIMESAEMDDVIMTDEFGEIGDVAPEADIGRTSKSQKIMESAEMDDIIMT